MTRWVMVAGIALAGLLSAGSAAAQVVKGGAFLASVSNLIKIPLAGGSLEGLKGGDVLFVFTEKGDPVTRIAVKEVFSDEIHSDPIPAAVADRIRRENTILIFSNKEEYGEYIQAFLAGTEEAFRAFLGKHPESELKGEARRVADGIAYRPYKLQGTVGAFREFLGRYPDNLYRENALARVDELTFAPVRRADLLEEYRRFLEQNPSNRHVPEAKARMAEIRSLFPEVSVDQLVKAPASQVGRKVQFLAYLHSILPIYVEGASVGRKTAAFESPRNSLNYLNFQAQAGGEVLWRLFLERDRADLTSRIQLLPKGTTLRLFGTVFSSQGNAPWVDVMDLEVVD